jgi:hypothetical protein
MLKPSRPQKICACGNECKGTKNDCDKCYQRMWRAKNPERSVFNHLKNSAQRRRVGFFLIFEEFFDWLTGTEEGKLYMKYKGREAENLSIDRKRPELGYRAGNLQVLTVSQNTKKFKAGECWPIQGQTKEEAGTPF